jgi:Domain of unknown function (DUF4383)
VTTTMARKVISVLGAVYLLIGVLGFVPALVVPTAVAGQGLLLGIFAVNAIHNLAHLILGALMLYAGTSAARFWLLSRTLAAVFAVLVVGSVIAPIAEGVAINLPDTGLHLFSAIAMAYLAFASKPDVAPKPVVA